MLAYILALAVGLGSFALYMAAFFFPEVHRKNDLIWSGVGMFYALVLWVCAERITGGVLLGQTASVALLGWLGWQTLTLRRQSTPLEQQTAAPSAAEVKASLNELSTPEGRAKLSGQVSRQLTGLKGIWQRKSPDKSVRTAETSETESYVPLTRADFDTARRQRQVEEQLTAAATPIAAELATEELITSTEPPTLEAAIEETVAATIDSQPQTTQETVDQGAAKITEAAEVVADAIAESESPIATPTKSGGIFAPITNLFKGFGQQKETKPVYVRRQFRQEDGEAEPKSQKAAKEAKPVYVRKQFRKPESEAEAESETATNQPVDPASSPTDPVAEIMAEVVETTTTWQDSAGEMTAELIEDTVTLKDQTGEVLAEVVEDSITVRDQAGEVVAEVVEETITLKDEAFATFANLAEATTPAASTSLPDLAESASAAVTSDSEPLHESAGIVPEATIDTAEEIVEEMLEDMAAERAAIVDAIASPEAGGESNIELAIDTTVPEITPPTQPLADVSASDAPEPVAATSADPDTAQLPENPTIAEDDRSNSASPSATSDLDPESSTSDAPPE
ncbi:Ycf66 family protein [Pantanalinema rosaneae CENA516]|uniref:Ycf66 family protein n=1 Tax=Pantanalinema rosaneae TaxID=1620701 RepID=UPI003D6DF116